jgi:hypothetical protein
MYRRIACLICVLALAALAPAQAQNDNQPANSQRDNLTQPAVQNSPAQNSPKQITLPAGTKVLLRLESPIDTKSAHPGDGVYCQTAFPVTQDNIIVIPAGTYVKGQVMHVVRPGRVKGRAEIQVHFNTLIYPNGYSVNLPGSLESTPGSEHHSVSDKEGTVKADGEKGKDAGEVATWGATGSSLEMVLQRPLTLDVNPSTTQGDTVPRNSGNRLSVPQSRRSRSPQQRRPRIFGFPIP